MIQREILADYPPLPLNPPVSRPDTRTPVPGLMLATHPVIVHQRDVASTPANSPPAQNVDMFAGIATILAILIALLIRQRSWVARTNIGQSQ
jgi:hypothetical protein